MQRGLCVARLRGVLHSCSVLCNYSGLANWNFLSFFPCLLNEHTLGPSKIFLGCMWPEDRCLNWQVIEESHSEDLA